MKYEYSCSTSVIWASFDCGEVEADTKEEALIKAKAELKENFDKANTAFNHCDNTLGFRIEFNDSQIEINLAQ